MTPQFGPCEIICVLMRTFIFFPIYLFIYNRFLLRSLFKKKLIGIWLIYNVLASGVQPSESIMHISTFLKILFLYAMNIGVHVSFF